MLIVINIPLLIADNWVNKGSGVIATNFSLVKHKIVYFNSGFAVTIITVDFAALHSTIMIRMPFQQSDIPTIIKNYPASAFTIESGPIACYC